MSQSIEKYSSVSRYLHWAVAGMIVLQFVLAKLAENAADGDRTVQVIGLLANHKSVGITILGLAIIRLVWRWLTHPPPLPLTMPKWQFTASKLTHGLLYGLLFALPLSGWLMSSASAYSVSWFGLFQLPDFVAPNPTLKEQLETAHELLAKTLFVVALLHIGAAFKHLIIDRDGVMSRMTSFPALLMFVALSAGGIYALGNPGSKSSTALTTAPATASTAVDQQGAETTLQEIQPSAVAAAEEGLETGSGNNVSKDAPLKLSAVQSLPVWAIDYDKSYIRFTGDQAGAEFTGEWTSWEASLQFSAEALSLSRFNVTVNTTQVSSGDADRDSTIVDADWFDSAAHPTAVYRASEFSASSEGEFIADGQLTVKGLTSPVTLSFTVKGNGNTRVIEGIGSSRLLQGNALLDRLALGLGKGDWEDTSWVGQNVKVQVRVEATLP